MESWDYRQNISRIVAEAVQFCCKREHLAEEDFFRTLQAGQEKTHSRLRYALAKGISSYLGSIDDNLVSVYVYGSTMTDNAGFSSDIDLIVQVKSKHGRTQRALQILDSYLLISYQVMLGKEEFRMNCMLDVHLVDQDDIKHGREYGSIISSLFIAPIKVWCRA
ncbi:MAG: nucleotidyltransferase domain-containing protein [Dethiobacter sp.]|jgi:predicted nucleotidyltransferase|nr:nucleotidyltransferase domain-containing protein [Dethiobacter sp.]MBS3900990.1 nucleotidyltransferase domain-containing protein [Dethiobacter sp.]MBS3988789.1 nucleotidyltransferase domain-containing protein [Dethiobacter sp.]